jgi:hypothetical protein
MNKPTFAVWRNPPNQPILLTQLSRFEYVAVRETNPLIRLFFARLTMVSITSTLAAVTGVKV